MTPDVVCALSDEELSAYSAGDMPPPRADVIEPHVRGCPHCQRRLEALRSVDQLLTQLGRRHLPDGSADRVINSICRQLQPAAEIMTLREVAQFLRISLEELEEGLDELPAFELGGQIRIRRERLLAWIEQQERTYVRTNMQSQVARLRRGA